MTADDLSTDIGVAELCKKLDIRLDNRREQFWANMQQYTQEVLLLCGSGICISIMILLILYSTISLETERERRSFTILQRLGMSPWQRTVRVWGKALARSFCGVVTGWLLYIAYKTVSQMQNDIPFPEAVPNLLEEVKLNGLGFEYVAAVSIGVCFVLLTLCILPKRQLKREVREL